MRTSGSIRAEDQSSKNRRERIGGADRKVDSTGNDHECRPYGHDRNKARIFGKLRKVLRVQELILLNEDGLPLTGGVRAENAFLLPLRVCLEQGHFYFAAENCEQGAKNQNDQDQPTLLKTGPARYRLRGLALVISHERAKR